MVSVRSLTKSASPGLRVAGIVARGPARVRLHDRLMARELFVSPYTQEVALELVTSPSWPRHLRDLAAALRERRDTAIDALAASWPEAALSRVPSGGLHLWISLPRASDEATVVNVTERAGVSLSPGRMWFPAERPGPFIRLSYGAASAPAIRQAIATVAAAMAHSDGRGRWPDRRQGDL